jgi:hypothetical protein
MSLTELLLFYVIKIEKLADCLPSIGRYDDKRVYFKISEVSLKEFEI